MALRPTVASKLIMVTFTVIMMSCTKTTSEVPAECFHLWSGKQPDAETKIHHANYWQSGSLVKEYRLFMELQPSAAWQKEFMRENKLVVIDDDDEWIAPENAPSWFTPSKSYKVLKLPLPYGESRYFIDSATNHMFIFEIEM